MHKNMIALEKIRRNIIGHKKFRERGKRRRNHSFKMIFYIGKFENVFLVPVLGTKFGSKNWDRKNENTFKS